MTRLISVIGTPSPLFYATLNIVRALTSVAVGEHLAIVANSIAALQAEFPAVPAKKIQSLIVFSDYPEADLLSILIRANAPMAICLDDFITIAHLGVVSRGFGGVDAARFATMGLVNIEPIVAEPPRHSLLVNQPQAQLSQLIADLADLYRLPIDGKKTTEILASLGCADDPAISLAGYARVAVAFRDDARQILERRSPLENDLIDFLAAQYDGIARGRRLEKLEWPVYALLRPEFPDRLTIGPIELTGPARFIYYGPYFALPAGAWSADVSIEVGDCFSDDLIEIDVSAGKVLAAVRTRLPPEGVYGCKIRFLLEDPSKPVEIRLQLLTGAIEGVIRMHRIALHRISTLDEADADEEARREASLGA